MKPLISILMPVFNGEKYLKDAIDSILTQTYTHFEFIIVNDGSTDSSDHIIKSYKDPRIRYVVNKQNIGLDTTLNSALAIAKGVYIARMDADDISFPTRLEKQVAYMEQHPTCVMVGTQYINMDASRKMYEVGAQLQDNDEIHVIIQSLNTFCHGSVMFRASFMKKNNITYNHDYAPYEDYELWTRIAKLGAVANLPEVLYAYMNNPKGMYLSQYDIMIEGPKKLGKKLQSSMTLPALNPAYIKKLIDGRKKYTGDTVRIEGHEYPSNFMLAYQTFLYKLGLLYLKRKNYAGFAILALSFCLSPSNWFKEFVNKITT